MTLSPFGAMQDGMLDGSPREPKTIALPLCVNRSKTGIIAKMYMLGYDEDPGYN
jgi:hypothetical protein